MHNAICGVYSIKMCIMVYGIHVGIPYEMENLIKTYTLFLTAVCFTSMPENKNSHALTHSTLYWLFISYRNIIF